MSKITAAVRSFINEEEGATMVEYGIMVALIAVVCIAAVGALGTGVKDKFTAATVAVQ